MRSPEGDKSSIFTLDGPPFLSEQLSPPTAPTTLPDIVNLQIRYGSFFFFFFIGTNMIWKLIYYISKGNKSKLLI